MKCLICNPPALNNAAYVREGRCTQKVGYWSTVWPPVTLVLIGTILKEDGNDIVVFDGALKKNNISRFIKIIDDFKPDIVIIASSTPTIDSEIELSSMVKKKSRSIICLFGIHSSYFDRELLTEYKYIDFVIKAEPERTIQKLVQSLSKRKTNFRSINNLSYIYNDEFISTQCRFESNLDSFPFPDWNLIDLNEYRIPLLGEKYSMISTSRGCPYQCIFCNSSAYYGKILREMSLNRIMDEITNNIIKYKLHHFFFWADTFTINKEMVSTLCNRIISKKLKIKWVCNSRIDTVDQEMLSLMKKAGCWMISYGIESFDDDVLKQCGKRITADKSTHIINYTRDAGILSTGHFIIGLPGETNNSIETTIDVATKSSLNFAQFYSAVPFPGSNLYEKMKKNNCKMSLHWTDFDQTKAAFTFSDVSIEEINNYIKYAYKKFYNLRRMIVYIRLIRVKGIIHGLKKIVPFWRMING